MANSTDNRPFWRSAEFVLVASMLLTLLGIIIVVFWMTQSVLKDVTSPATKEMMEALLNHRKDLIAIILGAFGAWIGAGAAYFFGRENLREATSSILKMKEPSPEEILRRTTLADLKPRPLPRTFNIKDDNDKKVSEILGWLEKDPERFFATIVDEHGKVAYVADEEAIYRYIAAGDDPKKLPQDVPKYDAATSTIENVVDFIKKQDEYSKSKSWQSLIDTAIKLNQKASCALANETMDRERRFVTIVLDDKDIPVGYITTADIRKLLTSIGK